MQERFIERAANVGVDIGSFALLPLNLRFVRIAAIAILLIIATSLGWKASLVPDAEKNIAPVSPTARPQPTLAAEVMPHAGEEPAGYRAAKGKVQLKGRPAARLASVAISSKDGIATGHTSYYKPKSLMFAWQQPPTRISNTSAFWSQTSIARLSGAERHTLVRTSFSSEYVENCLAQDDCKPEKWAFHLDLKLTPAAFLSSPESVNAEAHIPALTFTTPAFYLDPARAQ